MTDKERYIELLDSWGVEYEVEDNRVIVEQGYIGFYVLCEFDDTGKFKTLGAYE